MSVRALLLAVFCVACGWSVGLQATPMKLPPTVGVWTAPEQPRVIDKATIFEYMNGAGELYLAYRFDHLDAHVYTSPDDGEILVEIYWLEGPDDAYGLLSGDWFGDSVALGDWPADSGRALYGMGLLRIAADGVYARVMTMTETEASRAAVMELGRAIVEGRKPAGEPDLISALPAKIPSAAGDWSRRADQTVFLRSHLVLNGAWYLASENILQLGHSNEAVFAPYERAGEDPKRAHALVVRYPDAGAALKGLASFRAAYLADSGAREIVTPEIEELYAIEDGWTGYWLETNHLVLLFEGPDGGTARTLLETIKTTFLPPPERP